MAWCSAKGQGQLYLYLLLGVLSMGLKLPGCEVHHLTSNLVVRLRMHGAIPPLPNTS